MVSLWPWRGDDASPASFERALSILATKISRNSSQLESLSQRSRRLKALWTLYAGFAYILVAVVLGLVLGWKNWGVTEYTAVAGGPALIYLVRLSFRTYYDYRIAIVTSRLKELQQEREVTIDRLKAATKYNSTQELLEKYGGSSSQSPSSPASSSKRKSGRELESPATPKGVRNRVNIIPPPTANLPRDSPWGLHALTPQQQTPSQASPLRQEIPQTPTETIVGPREQALQAGPPEFAPNAFPTSPQYSTRQDTPQSRWYDRLLDILLGEDEMLPKNRLALICAQCKLVNGQAAPGVKRLADVGKWRCGGCGAWNGEEDEGEKLVKQIKQQAGRGREQREIRDSEDDDSEDQATSTGADGMIKAGSNSEVEGVQAALKAPGEDEAMPKTKRGRPKGSGKRKG